MTTLTKKIVCSLVPSLLLCPSLFAISLEQTVREVTETNPEILEKVRYYRAIKEDLKRSHSGYRPTVDLTGTFGYEQTDSPSTGFENRDLTAKGVSLQLKQNLFNGFGTQNEIKQQEARVMSAAYGALERSNAISLEAVEAYLSLMKHRDLLALELENVQTHQEIFVQIKERTEGGFSRLSDLLQTEGRLMLAQGNYVAQQNNFQDAISNFHKVLGRFENSDSLVKPALDVNVPETSEEAIAFAMEHHPAIKVANYNVTARDSAYAVAEKEFFPTVDLTLKQDWKNDANGQEGDNEQFSALINLNYNLYNGNADEAQRQKRLSEIHQENEFRNKVRRQVIEKTRLAWMAYTMLDKQHEFFTKHTELSEKTLDAYVEEFKHGKRDLLNILDGKIEYNTARQSQITAEYDRLLSQYRLLEGMGMLTRHFNIDIEPKVNLDASPVEALSTKDTLPLDMERDRDSHYDMEDVCDNSERNSSVGTYGCLDAEKILAGAQLPEIASYVLPVIREIPEETAEPVIEVTEAPVIQNLNFLFDSVELTEASKSTFEIIIEKVKAIMPVYLEIFTHTDNMGTNAYNMDLSSRRANTIKELFVSSGIPEENIIAYGMGEEYPVADNNSTEGRKTNRRVEFRASYSKPVPLSQMQLHPKIDLQVQP